MTVYEMITKKIIEALENGEIPWQKPWVGTGGAISYATGKPYSLINQLWCGESGEYATKRAIELAGGEVKPEELKKYRPIFCKCQKVIQDPDDPEKVIETGKWFFKFWQMYNVETQCTGIEPRHKKKLPCGVNPIKAAENVTKNYISREKINFSEGGDRACYAPLTDTISMPTKEAFYDTSKYYSTIFHEMGHSTGATTRLNRNIQNSFGTEQYSKEELVAEITAACLLNVLGIDTENSFDNSAAYIQSWLKALKNDSQMIVKAAAKADAAYKFILGE